MSRWLGKQASFESPGAGYQRRQSEGEGEGHHKGKLNRSLTISSRPGANARQSREVSSPLKRFSSAKDAIRRAFHHLSARLNESQEFMRVARDGGESEGVAQLAQRTQGIQEILSRDHMKVAFFGRTSNGKSTVINALLHGRVLPVGIGHTTNCFCSVVGAEGGEGYLLTGDSQERRSIKSLQQLAHSLSSQHLDPSALVRIFWPKIKCALLAEDVEFVDSPGVDMNPNMDEWITKHCLDADVFVLVSNAESTLMNAEKSFFHRVSERLSKPNIFILNNRWDASDAVEIPEEGEEGEEVDGGAAGPQLMEQVLQQHLQRDVKFLAEELRVTDEQTARRRVFFVSAKEVLHYRLKKLQHSTDPGQGLAPGHKARLQSFEQFERRFKECLSSSAIRTKFEQHHKQGLSVVRELGALLAQEDSRIQAESERVSQELVATHKRAHQLAQQDPALVASADRLVGQAVEQVQASVTVAMRDVLAQLPAMVDGYQTTFDPRELGPYREGLFVYFDEQLSAELGRLGSSALGRTYEGAQGSLIESYQALLQLSSAELAQLGRLVPTPQVSYVLRCADLCEDFREDLQFHFSLGLNTLVVAASAGSWLSSLQSQLSRLQALVSLEYAIPIAVLVAAVMLPRFLSWRVLVPAVLGLGGLYSYEWLGWTPRSQEAALKRQFVHHMRDKVQLQVKATNNSYVFQMRSNLGLLQSHLHQRLTMSRDESKQSLVSLAQQQNSLSALHSRLKAVRNAVQLSSTDLETFREDFLEQ